MQLSSIEQVWVSASALGEIGLRYYWSDQPTETQTGLLGPAPPLRANCLINIIIPDPHPDTGLHDF